MPIFPNVYRISVVWLMTIWKFKINYPDLKVKSTLLNNEIIVWYHPVTSWGFINLFIYSANMYWSPIISRHKGYNSDTLKRDSVHFQEVYSTVNEAFSSINRINSKQLHILINSVRKNQGHPKKLHQKYLAWMQDQGVLSCSDAKTWSTGRISKNSGQEWSYRREE